MRPFRAAAEQGGERRAEKTGILETLGDHSADLLLIEKVHGALQANERVKYLLSLLQLALTQAQVQSSDPDDLSVERRRAGIDDADLDRIMPSAALTREGGRELRASDRIVAPALEETARMIAPLAIAGRAEADPLRERWTRLAHGCRPFLNGHAVKTGSALADLLRGAETRSSSGRCESWRSARRRRSTPSRGERSGSMTWPTRQWRTSMAETPVPTAVVHFGGAGAAGQPPGKERIGAKGHHLLRMWSLGLPVPAGFIIETEACREFLRSGSVPADLAAVLVRAIARLEQESGRRFADKERPLLVSVRSGAAASMPGMLERILDIGLRDANVEGLAADSGNPRSAWDSCRRLISSFGSTVRRIPRDRFAAIFAEEKRRSGAVLDREVDAETPSGLAVATARRRTAPRRAPPVCRSRTWPGNGRRPACRT